MILSAAAFARARRFVATKARPLELARLRFHFDSAPAVAVLAELQKFQNADGGFGKALEPDLRASESSALATSVAFQIIREVGRAPSENMALPLSRRIVELARKPQHMVPSIVEGMREREGARA